MRGRWVPCLVPVLALLLLPTAGAEEEQPDPFESPVRALLASDDPGLGKVYDGIRKGLEQAQLPRVRRVLLAAGDDAALDALVARPPPLLFVLGAQAAARLGDRLAGTPCVFVDTAWDVNGRPVPPPPVPSPPAGVVRGVTSGAWVAEALRAAFPTRPRGGLSWMADTPALAQAAAQLADAAGFRWRPPDDVAPPDVLLHLRLGLGETVPSLEAVTERAARLGIPLLSDDVAHWGRGAAVLVLPDHHLLGRVAADVGRRLLAQDEPRVLRRRVRLAEMWVDLGAARRCGIDLPVPFLAGVDRLRGAPPRARPAGEGP